MNENFEKLGLPPEIKFSELKCVICNGSLTMDFKIPNDANRLFALVHDCLRSHLTITISSLV